MTDELDTWINTEATKQRDDNAAQPNFEVPPAIDIGNEDGDDGGGDEHAGDMLGPLLNRQQQPNESNNGGVDELLGAIQNENRQIQQQRMTPPTTAATQVQDKKDKLREILAQYQNRENPVTDDEPEPEPPQAPPEEDDDFNPFPPNRGGKIDLWGEGGGENLTHEEIEADRRRDEELDRIAHARNMDAVADDQYVKDILERKALAAWLNENVEKAGFAKEIFTANSNMKYMKGMRKLVSRKLAEGGNINLGRGAIQGIASFIQQDTSMFTKNINRRDLSLRVGEELDAGLYDGAIAGVFEKYINKDGEMDPLAQLVLALGFSIMRNHQAEGMNDQERAERQRELQSAIKSYVTEQFSGYTLDQKRELIMSVIRENPQLFMQYLPPPPSQSQSVPPPPRMPIIPVASTTAPTTGIRPIARQQQPHPNATSAVNIPTVPLVPAQVPPIPPPPTEPTMDEQPPEPQPIEESQQPVFEAPTEPEPEGESADDPNPKPKKRRKKGKDAPTVDEALDRAFAAASS